MYTNEREVFRQAFFNTWQKYLKKSSLEPVESQLLEIILVHSEYHQLLENPAVYEQQEFNLEENPFLHMGLHLAVREQIRCDRPIGIREIYTQLLNKYKAQHEVEHLMMQCFANFMWRAQQSGQYDDLGLLDELKKI